MLKKLYQFYKYFVMLITVVIMIVVDLNVFSRYVLNSSLGWASELSRFLFIWLTFLGAVLAYEKNEHIGLNFVVDALPQKIKYIVKLIAELGVLIVIITLFATGVKVTRITMNVSPALEIQMSHVYMMVPISAVFMLGLALSKIKVRISNLIASFKSSTASETEETTSS